MQRIKRNALSNPGLHESMDSLPLNPRMDDRIRDEIDLSIGNRFRNTLQISDYDVQVRNTISGSRSNIFSSKELNQVQVRNTISGSRSNM